MLRLVAITSLGCPKNFVDTEIAVASLIQSGFGLCSDAEEADVQFINTCAFLKEARDEAEGIISEAIKWKSGNPSERRVIVGGCLTEWDREGSLRSRLSGVDAWTKICSVAEIGPVAASLYEGRTARGITKDSPYIYDHSTPRVQLTPPHYAYIKIADGCDNHCTYCMIPSIRGELRSRTLDSVVSEAQSLLENGVRELIIIAQDSAAFGRDKAVRGESLAKLVSRLDRLKSPSDYWIRLMYLHPASVTNELLEALRDSKHVVRCLEMPLQHISDNILRSMNRKISSAQARSIVNILKKDMGFALRTTFMTGFPGETEADFRLLADFVEETSFERLGVFAYSREEGSPASKMPNQVDADIAAERRDELMKIQSRISRRKNSALVGRKIDVIVDGMNDGGTVGRTFMDAPDIDNIVKIKSGKAKLNSGDFIRAVVESASEYELGVKIGSAK